MGRLSFSLLLTIAAAASSTQAASPTDLTPPAFSHTLDDINPSGARQIELAPGAKGEWKEIAWQEYSDILCDPQGGWTIKDVSTEPISRDFFPNNAKKPTPCDTGALWIRIRLHSNLPFNHTWWLDAGNWQLVELYSPPFDEHSPSRSGLSVPLPERTSQEVHPYAYALPLRIAMGPREMDVFLRLSGNLSDTSQIGGVIKPFLAGGIGKTDRKYLFLFANILGVLLALGVYHLIVSFRVREMVYFYFSLSMLGYALRVALYDGLLLEFIWPNFPRWDNFLRPLAYPVWEVPFFLFLMTFLRTKENMPRIHVFIKLLLVTAALSPLGTWLLPAWHGGGWYQPTLLLLSVVWGATPICVATLAWRNRRREALLFLAANLLILIHTITQGLFRLHLISIRFSTFWIWYTAVSCAAILFSLALAEHIRRLRLEKELAKREEARKLTRVKQAELEAARITAEINQARWRALKNQLQPHFLFTKLNSIMALMHQDVSLAQRKLALLSDILRIVLQESGGTEVRLAEEIKFINRSLEIDNKPGLHNASIIWKIAPDTTDCLIPMLTLQGLVEDTLANPAKRARTSIAIAIRSWRDGGNVKLAIEVELFGLLGNEEKNAIPKLDDLRARLHQTYGATACLATHQTAGEGYVITITLPYRTTEASRNSSPPISGIPGEFS